MSNQIVVGSLGAISKNAHISLAESFVNAEVILLVDSSGSMNIHDSVGGRSRFDQAITELIQLQKSLPGKIAIVSFSDEVEFCQNGIPTFFKGGTDLAKGLRFIRQADAIPGMKFLICSDGKPNSETEAMAEARKFKNKIDVIYMGPEDRPEGREFLQKLASVTGGKAITADRAKELQSTVMGLIGAGK